MTDPCGTPNRTIFCVDRAEPRRKHSILLVNNDWNQSNATPLIPKEIERPCQFVVVDCIKCCGLVKQGEYRQVAVVDCIQNVSQYFQHGRLGRGMCPICRLQA